MADFETEIQESSSGYIVDLARSRAPTVVAFSGMADGIGVPRFEFFRLLSDLGCNRVFVRDHEQCFYQAGVRGLGDDPAAAAAELRRRVMATRPSSVLLVGNSAGGFGALLAGSRFPEADVLAIVPQTFVDSSPTDYERTAENLARVVKAEQIAASPEDLDIARCGFARRQRIEVHYGADMQRDALHARHISPPARAYAWPSNRHALARQLHDRGLLRGLLEEAITAADRAGTRRRLRRDDPPALADPYALWEASPDLRRPEPPAGGAAGGHGGV